MHPIERLRLIARVDDAPTALVVAEAAAALQATASDPMELLTACRRLIAWRPGAAPLVWLAARMVASTDPVAEARAAAEAIRNDATDLELARALPAGQAAALIGRGEIAAVAVPAGADLHDCDLVVIESAALSELGALCPPGSADAAALVGGRGGAVWLVAGQGRHLPAGMWVSLRDSVLGDPSADADSGPGAHEVLSLDLFDCMIGPCGPMKPGLRGADPGCPDVPGLFR